MTEEHILLCKQTAEEIMLIATDKSRTKLERIPKLLGTWCAFGNRYGDVYLFAVLIFLPPDLSQLLSSTLRGVPKWKHSDQQTFSQELAATQKTVTADQVLRICRAFTDGLENNRFSENKDLMDVLEWSDRHTT